MTDLLGAFWNVHAWYANSAINEVLVVQDEFSAGIVFLNLYTLIALLILDFMILKWVFGICWQASGWILDRAGTPPDRPSR